MTVSSSTSRIPSSSPKSASAATSSRVTSDCSPFGNIFLSHWIGIIRSVRNNVV